MSNPEGAEQCPQWQARDVYRILWDCRRADVRLEFRFDKESDYYIVEVVASDGKRGKWTAPRNEVEDTTHDIVGNGICAVIDRLMTDRERREQSQ